ncbi:polysaccharide biosynthesis protein [Serratia sp. D1N4]
MTSSNGFLKKFALYVPVKLMPALLTVFFTFFLYRFFPSGEYVAYSVSLACSLIIAQLGAMWVGNSFIYYYSGVDDKKSFFSNSLYLVSLIAPIASTVAAFIATFFSADAGTFTYVWWLCISQIYFFFMSSVCQAGFLVRQQLVAVVMQAIIQVGLIFLLFSEAGVTYGDAMVALGAGYATAATIMLASVVWRLGINMPFLSTFKSDVKSIYNYGAALAPWMFGMLVMAGADRFSISYLDIPSGDSYLSLKDLFVGAGGLLSMPLLMLVHPLVIKRFREGVFDGKLIQSSMGFLITVFMLLWTLIVFVGFQVFEIFTNKPISTPPGVLLIAFIGVFLNCAAVYVQKRLEVHRKMKPLAYLSLFCAVMSVVLSYLGGLLLGLYGAVIGVLLGQLTYFVLVSLTVFRKVNFYKGIAKPFVVSLFAMLVGYLLHLAVLSLPVTIEWWVGVLMWTLMFVALSLVVLWKSVAWSDFTKARLE